MSPSGRPTPEVLVVSPTDLETLAAAVTSLSRRLDDVAVAAGGAFAELAAAVPGSLLATSSSAGQSRCPEMLHAEAGRLLRLGEHLAATARAYRENERRLSAWADGLVL